ncbi:hypothetical protein BDQ17DRAFT_1369407 [Cyathus striatus]|nr:hypothetical protein BDQ17DRAFT_1369407 [Cyathus striatus]
MNPVIYYWNKFYYEGLHDLHKMCEITTYDASRFVEPRTFKLNKQEKQSKSSSYTEDITRKQGKSMPSPHWERRTGYIARRVLTYMWEVGRYDPLVISPNICLLSWIGITTLEDCITLMGTVFETIDLQKKRGKRHTEYLQTQLSHSANEEDWENIARMEADGYDSDMGILEVV